MSRKKPSVGQKNLGYSAGFSKEYSQRRPASGTYTRTKLAGSEGNNRNSAHKKKRSPGKLILKILLAILCILLVFVAGALTYFTVTEYKPADIETVEVSGDATKRIAEGDDIKVLTWNIGYGALGDNADFFMDGGEMVTSSTEERVVSNMTGIAKTVNDINPDVAYFQEVDQKATRSHNQNEMAYLAETFTDYTSSYALNFNAFVPYPLPPIGHVEAGLQTLSKYDVTEATRVQLPCPFKWPVRTVNLKRCLLVSRVPLKDSDKELVLINLHLEAYDDGEGKIAQTRQLYELMKAEYEKGNYVIAAGDFNQSFSNVDTSMYPTYEGMWLPGELDASVFQPDFTLLQDNKHPSCRSLDKVYKGADKKTFQYYLIDGFIVSANVDVKSVKTQSKVDFEYADHDPVLLKATLTADKSAEETLAGPVAAGETE